MIIKNSFCDKCIVDSLRKGKKECPACRVKIASHRDLRQESRIDFLLGTLLGDLDHYEDMQTQRFERITKTLNIQALRTSVEEGLKRQATAKRKRYSSDLPEKLPPKKRKFVMALSLLCFFFPAKCKNVYIVLSYVSRSLLS